MKTSPAPFLLAILSVVALSIPARLAAQQAPPPSDDDAGQPAVESLLESTDDDSALSDELEDYRTNRLNLYTVSPKTLCRLPGITPVIATRLLQFVQDSLPTRHSQLRAVSGITPTQLSVLRTYTLLKIPKYMQPGPDTLYLNVRSRWARDLQPRRGYHDALYRLQTRQGPGGADSLGHDTVKIGSTYVGADWTLATRVLLALGRVSAGITFEKDAGEPLLYYDTTGYTYRSMEHTDTTALHSPVHTRPGSFLSAHARVYLGAATVYVGDYLAEFGQGLTLWTGTGGGGKSGDVLRAPYKAARGVQPYRSGGEFAFLRGAAVTLHPGGGLLPQGWSATALASVRNLDATLYRLDSADVVGSVPEDGYRRTRSELRRAGALQELLLGGNLQYDFTKGHAGLTGFVQNSSARRAADFFYEYSGDRVVMLGLNAEYRLGKCVVFAEASRATDGTVAMLAGAQAQVGRLGLTLCGRLVPARFYTPHGTGFGQSPYRQSNEQGLYAGFSFPAGSGAQVDAYLDLYRHPERTYSVPFPTTGADGYLQYQCTILRRLRLLTRLRTQHKTESATITRSDGRRARLLIEKEATNGRIEAEYSTADGMLSVRGRVDRTAVDYPGNFPMVSGLGTYAELRYRPLPNLTLSLRVTVFSTDNFDAAVYEYEPDVPGRSATAALSGQGRRVWLLARWNPLPNLTLAAKYSETLYADRSLISPGDPQQINGPLTNTFTVQMEWGMGNRE